MVITILVIAAIVGGLVLYAATGEVREAAESSYPTPSFTYSTQAPTTAGAGLPASSGATTAPRTTAGSARTTAPFTTTAAKPTGPQAVAATADNPLFGDPEYGLQNIQCSYPSWSTDVVVARAFFQAAMDCLDRMWRPVLQAANLPFHSPNLSVTAGGVASACTGGTGNFAAFYCSADETIYMPIDHVIINEDPDDTVVFLGVFAHEYGHHVQALSGITAKESRDRYNAGSASALGTELSRRLELEAQCFGGMFIGSSEAAGTVTAQQGQHTIDDSYGRGDRPGDVRDHGTTEHYGAWWAQGYRTNRTPNCNTWSAAASDVA
jgi:predicted metalloprotease